MLLALESLLWSSTPAATPINPNWLIAAPPRRFTVKAPPRNFSFVASKRRFLLVAHQAPFIGDFSPFSSNEYVSFFFDFGPQLSSGDVISPNNWGASVYSGVDPNADGVISAAGIPGSVVGLGANVFGISKRPGKAVPGVVYRVFVKAYTQFNSTIYLYAHVACAPNN